MTELKGLNRNPRLALNNIDTIVAFLILTSGGLIIDSGRRRACSKLLALAVIASEAALPSKN